MAENVALSPAVLIASGAVSSSAGTITGTPVTWRNPPRGATCSVRVAVAPTSSNACTLDVYLQHSPDYVLAGPASSNFGATWDDFLHFTQIASTSSAGTRNSQLATWNGVSAPSSSLNMHVPATASLAAGQVINGPLGGSWRAQVVVGGTSPVAASSSAWNVQVVVAPVV